jgi:hypothetical protein
MATLKRNFRYQHELNQDLDIKIVIKTIIAETDALHNDYKDKDQKQNHLANSANAPLARSIRTT